MSEVLKVYTADQTFELCRLYLLSKGVGLTNLNDGGRTEAILRMVAEISSTTGMDYLTAMRKAIPVMMYDGMDFEKKSATYSTGYFRFYRIPIFIINYTGAGTSCLMTLTDSSFTTVCAGAGGDNITAAFATYTTISALIAYINGIPNYSASLVNTTAGGSPPISLYHYAGKEVKGQKNYLDAAGTDVLLAPAAAITIPSSMSLALNGIQFLTTSAGSIAAGNASSGYIPAVCAIAGRAGDINAQAIDTRNGAGVMNSQISGVEYVRNDSAFANGTDAETDIERKQRFQTYIRGLSSARPEGIESRVEKIQGVKSCTVRVNWPYSGTNTVIVDDGTGTVSPALLAAVNQVLDGNPDDLAQYPGCGAAGISFVVTSPTIITVPVTLAVYRIGSLSDATEVGLAVQSAIERYINTRKLGQDIVFTELVALAKKAHSAVYDVAMSTPLVNVPIHDAAVARTGSVYGVAVTVTIVTYPSVP